MTVRKGIVVAVHENGHMADLVMSDGARLAGVPIAVPAGSSARTGRVDLPVVPVKKDKWDITQRDGQDMEALVDTTANGTPVITGFLFPQVNQVVPTAPGTRVDRHQSDVVQTLDASGNLQISWPNGTYLRVGEAPDSASLGTHHSSATDRNTSKRMHVRLGLAGGAFTLTITPDGACTMEMKQDFTIKTDAAVLIEAEGSATVKAPNITLDGDTTITKNLDVQGATSVKAITSNGKNISDTHRHANSGGPSVGGVPV